MSTRVLVVEDEESFVEALRVGLRREGFEVEIARTGPEALHAVRADPPELVLLDVMLPGISGLDVCREIRQHSSVPVIMVTARAEEIDAVVGLEVGADDYVTKPYRLRELVARMRAVLRRAAAVGAGSGLDGSSRSPGEVSAVSQPAGPDEDVLEVGDVRVDLDRHEVRVRGEKVSFPLKEFQLLTLLMENRNRVLPRGLLIDRVWGHDYVGDTKTLDVHVKRVRQKIEADPSSPAMLITVRGVGYKFVEDEAPTGGQVPSAVVVTGA